LGYVWGLDCVRLLDYMGNKMRVRRYHAIEVARYYQRLENIERRKKEEESKTKKRSIFARLVGRK
jgi:hypothetical protein